MHRSAVIVLACLGAANLAAQKWVNPNFEAHRLDVNVLKAKEDDRGKEDCSTDPSWDGSAAHSVCIDRTLNDALDCNRGYVVEMAVSWKELRVVPFPGMHMGINFANGDNDGMGRQLFDWAGAWPMRSPNAYGELVLQKDRGMTGMDPEDPSRKQKGRDQVGQSGRPGSPDSPDWPASFDLIEITSSLDRTPQKAYYRQTAVGRPMPLLVRLHSWGGDYSQKDGFLDEIEAHDWNYIHPDFRGANRNCEACCSELALADIDDAIDYAMARGQVDSSSIYILGASGGGYATLCMFMRSRHRIRSFHAWCPISDLSAWYRQCLGREKYAKYAADIVNCICSPSGTFDEQAARGRSPYYWNVPVEKFGYSSLHIYTGVHDGVTGSVPITHSIKFYNKVLSAMGVEDTGYYVSPAETAFLLEHRRPVVDFGIVCGRKICLQKTYEKLSLTIHDKGHGILPCAFELICEQHRLSEPVRVN